MNDNFVTSYSNSRRGEIPGNWFINGLPVELIQVRGNTARCVIPTAGGIFAIDISPRMVHGSFALQQHGVDDGLRNLFLREAYLMKCRKFDASTLSFVECGNVTASVITKGWDAWRAQNGDDAILEFAEGWHDAKRGKSSAYIDGFTAGAARGIRLSD